MGGGGVGKRYYIRMSLESSFGRDLSYTAAWLLKKAMGYIGWLHHMPDIPYDTFHITV